MKSISIFEEPRKMLAFKLYKSQVSILKKLSDHGIYTSISEAVRDATIDLLSIIYVTTNTIMLNKEMKTIKGINKIFTGQYESITAKFPIYLIKSIDYAIVITNMKNRSELIRIAVSNALKLDKLIFTYYLKEKITN